MVQSAVADQTHDLSLHKKELHAFRTTLAMLDMGLQLEGRPPLPLFHQPRPAQSLSIGPLKEHLQDLRSREQQLAEGMHSPFLHPCNHHVNTTTELKRRQEERDLLQEEFERARGKTATLLGLRQMSQTMGQELVKVEVLWIDSVLPHV
jgi:hypothetical protein